MEGVSRCVSMELHNIANSGYPQSVRVNIQSSNGNDVSSALSDPFVVGSFMHQRAFCRKEVLVPLLLDVDEGPLSTAEGEMLDSRECEVLLLVHLHETKNGYAVRYFRFVDCDRFVVVDAARRFDTFTSLSGDGIEEFI